MQATIPAGLDRKQAELYHKLDPSRLPKHIAIIMDGNGRWARRRHMPRVAGHREGVAAVRLTVRTAAQIGISALTLYAFSEENWKKRPKTEVDFLMRLLARFLKLEVPELNKNNIRLDYIGRIHELPESVQERMEESREMTSHNTGMLLTLALNYSARSEIVDAFRSIASAAARNGGIDHMRSTKIPSRNISTRATYRIPISSSAPAVKCGLATSSCGNSLMPRSMSCLRSGPTSMACICSIALRSIRSVSAATAASTRITRRPGAVTDVLSPHSITRIILLASTLPHIMV